MTLLYYFATYKYMQLLLSIGNMGTLLGDSAYMLATYMLTPFRNPKCRAEERYNNAQRCTRVLVESTIGILKARLVCST